MITLTKEKITVEGIEVGIPKSCIGLADEDNQCYGIAHIHGEMIDQQTATELMEETLNGECEYEGVISAVKIFAAFDMDCEKVDFTDDDVLQDFGAELYADIMDLENYIDNNGKNYAYDTHPQIKYRSRNVLSYYWLDCHNDAPYYNYVLVCRMSNVSTTNGTYAIYCEFLLPPENWKEELQYLLSRVTCGEKPAMDRNELSETRDFVVENGVLLKYLGDAPYVTIPDGVEEIGEAVFLRNATIQTVVIPESVRIIREQAFSLCSALESVVVTPYLTELGENAFYSCKKLEKLTGGTGMQKIGGVAFCDCVSLHTLEISAHGIEIGDAAFHNCRLLANENGLIVVNDILYGVNAPMPNVTVPEGVTIIDRCAFDDDLVITDVALPKSVKKIKYSAFSGCKNLCKVNFPDSLDEIEISAFFGCTSLQEITIENEKIEIGVGAFSNCSNLEKAKVPSHIAIQKADVFPNCPKVSFISQVESPWLIENGIVRSYLGADKDVCVPEGIVEIGEGAFKGNEKIVRITLPVTVKKIGTHAFRGCTNLESLDMGDSVEELGEGICCGCEALQEVTLSSKLTNIEKSTFYGCSSLAHIDIPDAVTEIKFSAFAKCQSLLNIRLGPNTKFLHAFSFAECLELTDVILEHPSPWIFDNAFKGSKKKKIKKAKK